MRPCARCQGPLTKKQQEVVNGAVVHKGGCPTLRTKMDGPNVGELVKVRNAVLEDRGDLILSMREMTSRIERGLFDVKLMEHIDVAVESLMHMRKEVERWVQG